MYYASAALDPLSFALQFVSLTTAVFNNVYRLSIKYTLLTYRNCLIMKTHLYMESLGSHILRCNGKPHSEECRKHGIKAKYAVHAEYATLYTP